MMNSIERKLRELMKMRILIMDGAMGTMIQQYKLTEADYRADRFVSFTAPACEREIFLRGSNELLSLTRPQVIEEIHGQYLAAGADIIETNTFGANAIAQADYYMLQFVREMNIASAKIARKVVDQYSTSDKPRFVAGAIGPTPKTASISPDVNNPGARNVTFDELVAAYREQIEALVEGGVDILLVETVFDTLNCKAALFALAAFFEDSGTQLPVMVSGTVTDASGRLLSGQTVEAFWISIRHIKPMTVGLNCALGAALMRPYAQELATLVDTAVCIYPNAGLPNPMSETGFDETPTDTARMLDDFAQAGLLNIAGGCCGTTPAHISAIAQALALRTPRQIPSVNF